MSTIREVVGGGGDECNANRWAVHATGEACAAGPRLSYRGERLDKVRCNILTPPAGRHLLMKILFHDCSVPAGAVSDAERL